MYWLLLNAAVVYSTIAYCAAVVSCFRPKTWSTGTTLVTCWWMTPFLLTTTFLPALAPGDDWRFETTLLATLVYALLVMARAHAQGVPVTHYAVPSFVNFLQTVTYGFYVTVSQTCAGEAVNLPRVRKPDEEG